MKTSEQESINDSEVTIFENVWYQPSGHLFRSKDFGVMAIADIFPRLPLQIVIAPKFGNYGVEVRFSDLPRIEKRKLHEVADAFEEKLNNRCKDNEKVITHTEGFNVTDHAHIVLGIAEKGRGQDLYNGENLGELAVARTIELLTLKTTEAHQLEQRLQEVR